MSKIEDGHEEVKRPCTCHPDDNPPSPCQRKYALQDCRAAVVEKLVAFLDPLFLNEAVTQDQRTAIKDAIYIMRGAAAGPMNTEDENGDAASGPRNGLHCKGCGNAIDPDWCCCGDSVASHGMGSGHSPVSMGCACGYERPQPIKTTADERPEPVNWEYCQTCGTRCW